MKYRVAITSVALGVLGYSIASAASMQSGAYAAGVYVSSASGAGCIDRSGATYASVLNYEGISGAAAGLRTPLPVNGASSVEILSIKSGKGETKQSGTFTLKVYSQQGLGYSTSGNFSATLVPIDNLSFLAHVQQAYTNCNETLEISLARVGAKQ